MIKLVVFDMDGTVFKSHLDWLKIREELNILPGGNILEEIYMNNQVDKKRLEILENYEKENTLKTEPIKGIPDFLSYLRQVNITTVLLTNNNRENTHYLLNKFDFNFDLVITRELKLWKPDPDAFFYAMKKTGYTPEETISIGDSHYDVKASRRANVPYIFIIKTPRSISLQKENPDIILFHDYIDLKNIIKEKGLL
ncbi:MAG: HAD family hydrolase [Candidatus Aminicenantes bacterium]|jgi:HAD superfamily hydrolase (TIGR01509 family)